MALGPCSLLLSLLPPALSIRKKTTPKYISKRQRRIHGRKSVDSCIFGNHDPRLGDLHCSTTTAAATTGGHAATTMPTKSVEITAVAVWRRTRRSPLWRLRAVLRVQSQVSRPQSPLRRRSRHSAALSAGTRAAADTTAAGAPGESQRCSRRP
jgi:hypothetical protein